MLWGEGDLKVGAVSKTFSIVGFVELGHEGRLSLLGGVRTGLGGRDRDGSSTSRRLCMKMARRFMLTG